MTFDLMTSKWIGRMGHDLRGSEKILHSLLRKTYSKKQTSVFLRPSNPQSVMDTWGQPERELEMI